MQPLPASIWNLFYFVNGPIRSVFLGEMNNASDIDASSRKDTLPQRILRLRRPGS